LSCDFLPGDAHCSSRESLFLSLGDLGRLWRRLAFALLLLPFPELTPFPADALTDRRLLGVPTSLDAEGREERLRALEPTEALGAPELLLLTAPSEVVGLWSVPERFGVRATRLGDGPNPSDMRAPSLRALPEPSDVVAPIRFDLLRPVRPPTTDRGLAASIADPWRRATCFVRPHKPLGLRS